jgi:hypothetical protein
MSAFTDFSEACQRAIDKVNDGTWVEAFACYNSAGVIAVRLLRKKGDTTTTFDGETGGGSWDEVTDNAAT